MPKKQYTRASRLNDAAIELLQTLDQYEFQEADVTEAIDKFRHIFNTRPGQPRSDLPAQEIMRMRNSGDSQSKIAAHFGCSRDTVRRRLLECGLPLTTQEKLLKHSTH